MVGCGSRLRASRHFAEGAEIRKAVVWVTALSAAARESRAGEKGRQHVSSGWFSAPSAGGKPESGGWPAERGWAPCLFSTCCGAGAVGIPGKLGACTRGPPLSRGPAPRGGAAWRAGRKGVRGSSRGPGARARPPAAHAPLATRSR